MARRVVKKLAVIKKTQQRDLFIPDDSVSLVRVSRQLREAIRAQAEKCLKKGKLRSINRALLDEVCRIVNTEVADQPRSIRLVVVTGHGQSVRLGFNILNVCLEEKTASVAISLPLSGEVQDLERAVEIVIKRLGIENGGSINIGHSIHFIVSLTEGNRPIRFSMGGLGIDWNDLPEFFCYSEMVDILPTIQSFLNKLKASRPLS